MNFDLVEPQGEHRAHFEDRCFCLSFHKHYWQLPVAQFLGERLHPQTQDTLRSFLSNSNPKELSRA